jgi:Putative prokaryotic signal transducing protein
MALADLVTVRTFLNVIEAEVARSVLAAAGIDSLIRRDDCGGLRPHLQLSGVDLLVREHDLAEALRLLSTPAIMGLGSSPDIPWR